MSILPDDPEGSKTCQQCYMDYEPDARDDGFCSDYCLEAYEASFDDDALELLECSECFTEYDRTPLSDPEFCSVGCREVYEAVVSDLEDFADEEE